MVGRALFKSILVVVVALLFGAVTTTAQTSVYVSPASKNALPGSVISLGFYISNVINIHGYELIVEYDNTILQYNNAAPGTFINSFLFFPITQPPNIVDVAHTLIGNGTVTSGSGLLFTLQFTAIGSGTSPITITTADLRDGANNTIPATITSGSVTIGNPNVVYIDQTYTSGSAGGHDFGYDAFTGVSGGVSAVSTGGIVNIAAATYNETVTIPKNLTLTGVGNPTIQNLTVNTPAVTIGGSIQISNVLTLTSGVVTTGSNKITITNDQPGGVVITNGSIAGEICRTIAAGNTGEYQFTNRFSMVKPGPGQLLTTICFVAHPGVYPPNAPVGRAVHRYYEITPSISDFLADNLLLEYLPAENVHLINPLQMSLFRNANSTWYDMIGIGESSLGHTYVKAFVIDAWSVWAIGDNTQPLPIQLASFSGRVVNGHDVCLDWTTLSETNNFGFEVQKSSGVAYTTIPGSFIAGNGTTNVPHSYTFTDMNAGQGNWLYRLKQIDLDGTEHFTEPVIVNMTTDVGEHSLPTRFALEQNYPNPFNPSTTIGFAVPKQSHVTLEVFNTLGEKVATLLSQHMTAGRHTVDWKADKTASGVYIVRLTSGEFAASLKMLLSK